jgi:16S rRNA (cytosine1402-N4)-methyltransferase
MLAEVMAALAPRSGGIYVDCTFGRGGHSRALLERVGPGGRVLALDRDPVAASVGRELARRDRRLIMSQVSFNSLADVARAELGPGMEINGVLFDLGVSSPQLDDPARGFSFQQDGPLDMRMDPSTGMSAARWLQQAPEAEIARVLRELGEERYARRIARAIVAERRVAPIDTTAKLADIVGRASPSRERHKHPATRTFQAIRIHINDELGSLAQALQQALGILSLGGRLAVISFHSLEDRIVKRFVRNNSRPPTGDGLPFPMAPPVTPPLRAVGRIVRPGTEEIRRNPRARSAVLRVAERVA